jgi:hypothetical protein
MINENLKVSVVKMRLWPYYTNVYYKYTYESFNIDNEIYCYLKIILHNIIFVKIIVTQN